MRCPAHPDRVRAVLGELPAHDADQIRQHATRCEVCGPEWTRLQGMLQAVAQLPRGAAPSDAFIARVLEARAVPRPPIARGVGWGVRIGVITAVAAAAVFGIAPQARRIMKGDESPTPATGTFTARGPARPSSEPLSAELLCVLHGELEALPDRCTQQPIEGFALRYWNRTDRPGYLMAFAIDTAGTVHWLYPAYADAASDPQAMVLAPNTPAHLATELVQPEGVAAGPLRLVIAIDAQARSVREVDMQLERGGERLDLARVLPGARIEEWQLEWRPAP